MEMSENMMLIVLVCISGPIVPSNHYTILIKTCHKLLGMLFGYILNILCSLACIYTLTVKCILRFWNNGLRLQSLHVGGHTQMNYNMSSCTVGTAGLYHCVPISEMAQRRHLRSAAGHQLVVPSYHLNSCGLRAFSVLGPRLWNSLPRLLRDPSHNATSFGHSLKIFLWVLAHTAHMEL